ncbi:MAG: hypothetical protein K5787_03065, partial [Lentisphaeria bacterium]|nr:hypothetical protein [Lentisphaeria bacterium]
TEQVAGQTEQVAGQTEQVAGQTEQVAGQTEQVAGQTEQVAGQTERVIKLMQSLGSESLTRKELMERLNLDSRSHFQIYYLQPAINADLIEMTQPDSPNSPTQRYRKKTMDKTKPIDSQP